MSEESAALVDIADRGAFAKEGLPYDAIYNLGSYFGRVPEDVDIRHRGVQEASKALNRITDDVEKGLRKIAKERENPLVTPEQSLVNQHKYLQSLQQKMQEDVKVMRSGAERELASITDDIEKTFEPKSLMQEQKNSEIRAFLRGKSNREISAYLDNRLHNGDLEPVYAICNGRSELAGIREDTRTYYRDQVLLRTNETLFHDCKEVVDAINRIDHALNTATDWFGKIVDSRKAKVLIEKFGDENNG